MLFSKDVVWSCILNINAHHIEDCLTDSLRLCRTVCCEQRRQNEGFLDVSFSYFCMGFFSLRKALHHADERNINNYCIIPQSSHHQVYCIPQGIPLLDCFPLLGRKKKNLPWFYPLVLLFVPRAQVFEGDVSPAFTENRWRVGRVLTTAQLSAQQYGGLKPILMTFICCPISVCNAH